MAPPERSASASNVTVSVRVEGRPPYAMFDVVELTAGTLRLRSPVMLEIGERLALRVTRGERTVDLEGRIVAIDRDAGGGEPISTVELVDGAAVAPLLG